MLLVVVKKTTRPVPVPDDNTLYFPIPFIGATSIHGRLITRFSIYFQTWLKSSKRPELGILACTFMTLPYFWLTSLKIQKDEWSIILLALSKFSPMCLASCWITNKKDQYSQGVSLSLTLFAFRDFLSVLKIPAAMLHMLGFFAILILTTASLSQSSAVMDHKQKNLSGVILMIGLCVRWIHTDKNDLTWDHGAELLRIGMSVFTCLINLRSSNALGLALLSCGEMNCLPGDSMKLTWAGLLWLMSATPA